MPNFSITGIVADSLTGEPLEYATFILHREQDSTQVTGIASKENGHFRLDSLRPGRYFARVSFLGYDLKTLADLKLNREKPRLDLGRILLAPSGLTADEVVVEGERLSVEYHVEKKVINVAKQNIAPTGSAADILAQAPSVTVDIEGNVKLRGSSNFTVMIDGRPSVLDANDALQQIPSGTIDRIEIITNPSSRYSAEGTTGIINVIPLKRGANGVSGQINARSSIDERRGADFTLSQPVGKSALTIGGNVGIGRDPGESESLTRTTFEDVTTTVTSNGSSVGVRDNYSLRAELDVPVNDRNSFVFGGRFGEHAFGRVSNQLTTESVNGSADVLRSISRNNTERAFQHMHGFANWKHRFDDKDHELTLDLSFGGRDGDEEVLTEQIAESGSMMSGILSREDGPGRRLEFKTDYVRPLGGKRKFEAGLSSQFNRFNSDNSNSELDTTSGSYVEQTQFSNGTKFRRFMPAGYSMISGDLKWFEYQLGLRGEYLDRTVEETQTTQAISLSRFDLYPSVHTATHLGGTKELSLSYTRRVEHSRPWFLEPFITWENRFNVRQGNPGILPEFIDSYELGYQTNIFKQFASVEGFYRVKHNNVEMLRSVYSENVTLTRPENVGRQFSLGTELRSDIIVRKGWSIGLSGNLYDMRVNGETDGRSFDEHTFTYDGKLNSITALSKNTRLQVDANYNGPSVTSQGETEPFFSANLAVRQDFMKKALSVSLQARDIFATAKRESTIDTPLLYSYDYSKNDSPIVTLSLSYTFNNFKKKQDSRSDGNGDDF
ncbi:TonB-dependent receptor [bacterium]|nr:TonB-dependent receptor [bacterium]